jgi:DNA (cytosine-5)-methyltransferase 1
MKCAACNGPLPGEDFSVHGRRFCGLYCAAGEPTITIGSLFSGIGGLELGLERAGLGPVVWQCEVDPFCRQVLAKHWPNVTRFEDVTRPRNYPHVDLICGGFPCQDVSAAGRGRGIGGDRSSLWWHFADIVRKVSPRFVVVENVTSGKVRWLPYVRHTLHVLGYDTTALGIAARDVGAPHRRERVFVVAHSGREHLREQHRRGRGTNRSGALVPRGDGQAGDVANAGSARRQGAIDSERLPAERGGWAVEPDVGRVAHGLSGGLDGRKRRARLRALGNAVVPQCAEIAGRVILSAIGDGSLARWAPSATLGE